AGRYPAAPYSRQYSNDGGRRTPVTPRQKAAAGLVRDLGRSVNQAGAGKPPEPGCPLLSLAMPITGSGAEPASAVRQPGPVGGVPVAPGIDQPGTRPATGPGSSAGCTAAPGAACG